MNNLKQKLMQKSRQETFKNMKPTDFIRRNKFWTSESNQVAMKQVLHKDRKRK